jgi:predicted ester cyclase
MAENLEGNKALVRRLYARLQGAGDTAAADEIVTDDYVDHSLPGIGEGGRPELYALVAGVRSALPDVAPVVEQAVAEGDLVACRVVARGTHTGTPFPPGIPASGRSLTWTEQHTYRIANGRIAEHWGVADMLSILQQLGAVPVPG